MLQMLRTATYALCATMMGLCASALLKEPASAKYCANAIGFWFFLLVYIQFGTLFIEKIPTIVTTFNAKNRHKREKLFTRPKRKNKSVAENAQDQALFI